VEGDFCAVTRTEHIRRTGHGEHDVVRDVAAHDDVEDAWRLDGDPLRKPRVMRVRRAGKRIHTHRSLRPRDASSGTP
jgi:hypothetical protein